MHCWQRIIEMTCLVASLGATHLVSDTALALLRAAQNLSSPECLTRTLMFARGLGQVALLSLDVDETELMDHLNAAKDSLGSPLYSPQFALRVARQQGRRQASVALLCQLGLFEVQLGKPLQPSW